MLYERKISALCYKPLLFVASTFVLSFIYIVYIIHEPWGEMADRRNFILCVFVQKMEEKNKKNGTFNLSTIFYQLSNTNLSDGKRAVRNAESNEKSNL